MKDKCNFGDPWGASRKDVIISGSDMFGRVFTKREGEPHVFLTSRTWVSVHRINIIYERGLCVATEKRACD